MHAILLLAAFATVTFGQQTAWGKCGGDNWDGPTTCVAGYCCIFSNAWYSQCLPGSCSASSVGPASSTRVATTSTTRSSSVGVSTTTRSSTLVSTTTRSSSSTIPSSPSSTTTRASTTISTTTRTSSASISTFTNPLVYQDIPDNDVFLGPDGYFYLSASNFHFSPGAPILRSSDLQNWAYIGHSIPTLDFGDNYSLITSQAYRRGTWASSMRYRKSNKTWYWVGCIDFWNSFIYTASSPTGPWVRSASLWAKCFYDCGLFIDDDDTMYVVHGAHDVNITQLSPSGLEIAQTRLILSPPAGEDTMEGNRLYKRNGLYYILNDSPGGQSTHIWKSASPFGPWVSKSLQKSSVGPVAGGGTPHQGSLIETSLGDWYFISFTWAYPLGRIPVIAPITWGSDGYPILGLASGSWAQTYPNPLPQVPTPSWTGTDSFAGTTLGPRWEWNHNPDASKFVVNNGVTLSTVTVTNDLYLARNTLTHRFQGGTPIATIILDTSNMADGDRAGLAAFRDWSAYIGVVRTGSSYAVVMHQGTTLNPVDWTTSNLGTTVATASVPKGKIWLRGSADARPTGTKLVTFRYSLDGITYTSLGGGYTLNSGWEIFIGYRWGIFNYATKALGGSVKLLEFNQV